MAGIKYSLYQKALQSPVQVCELLRGAYGIEVGGYPTVLREDFAGSGLISNTWVSSGGGTSIMVDNDKVPMEWGKLNNNNSNNESNSIQIIESDVAEVTTRSDVTCALNFSWCALHDDDVLINYFKVLKNSTDLFMLDLYGGKSAYAESEWESESHVWKHSSWNPTSQLVKATVSFPSHNLSDVFQYHWRLRSMSHTISLLQEAGFTSCRVWMEDRTESGVGTRAIRSVDPLDVETIPYWCVYISAV